MLGDIQGNRFPNSNSNNICLSQLSSTLTPLALVLPPCSYHRPLWFQRTAYQAVSIFFLNVSQSPSVNHLSFKDQSYIPHIYRLFFWWLIAGSMPPKCWQQYNSYNRHMQNCALYLPIHLCKHFSPALRQFGLWWFQCQETGQLLDLTASLLGTV